MFSQSQIRPFLCCAALVAIGFPNVAGAQTQEKKFPPGGPEVHLMERNAELLDLSQEAKDKLSKLIKDHDAAEEELRDKRTTALEKQADLLNQTTLDEEVLLKVSNEISAVSKEGSELQIKTSVAGRALLTPDQLKQHMVLRATAAKKLGQQGRRGGRGQQRRRIP